MGEGNHKQLLEHSSTSLGAKTLASVILFFLTNHIFFSHKQYHNWAYSVLGTIDYVNWSCSIQPTSCGQIMCKWFQFYSGKINRNYVTMKKIKILQIWIAN